MPTTTEISSCSHVNYNRTQADSFICIPEPQGCDGMWCCPLPEPGNSSLKQHSHSIQRCVLITVYCTLESHTSRCICSNTVSKHSIKINTSETNGSEQQAGAHFLIMNDSHFLVLGGTAIVPRWL